MPASAMTTSLPRPRSVSGISRDRANRTIARSSWMLWTVAKRSAGPPTRIVVNRASGSSRDVLTPIRRWIAVPISTGSNARSPARGRHATAPREIRSIVAVSGNGRRSAAARTRAATASAAPGRPRPRAASAIATSAPRRRRAGRPPRRARPRRTPRRARAGPPPRRRGRGRSPSGGRPRAGTGR